MTEMRQRATALADKIRAGRKPAEPKQEPKPAESSSGAEALVASALQTIQDANKASIDMLVAEVSHLRTQAQAPLAQMQQLVALVTAALDRNTAAMEKIANMNVNVTVPTPKAPKVVKKQAGPKRVSMNLGNRVLTAEITEG